jgi:hypothetical protein
MSENEELESPSVEIWFNAWLWTSWEPQPESSISEWSIDNGQFD